MRSGVLLDAGPLIAYFCANENHHQWALETLRQVEPPLITCEPVLTEACFVVARNRLPAAQILEPVTEGQILIGLQLGEEAGAIQALMQRYSNVPMSLADACLVRLAELTDLPICTLGSDFEIYRAHGRRRLDLIAPPRRSLHET